MNSTSALQWEFIIRKLFHKLLRAIMPVPVLSNKTIAKEEVEEKVLDPIVKNHHSLSVEFSQYINFEYIC